MSVGNNDPDNVFRELERLAEQSTRNTFARIEEASELLGYDNKSLLEQKAFREGARVGGRAMLEEITAIIPAIIGLSPDDFKDGDIKEPKGNNPFA